MTPSVTPSPVTPNTGPKVSQAEAARLCKVSTATIRRRRPELVEYGAKPDPKGGWMIPISALVAVGLLDRATPPDTVTPQPVSPDTTQGMSPQLHAELEAAQREVVRLRQELAVAQAVVAERGQSLEDMRRAMLALTTGRDASAEQPPAPKPEPAPETPQRRRGWFAWSK